MSVPDVDLEGAGNVCVSVCVRERKRERKRERERERDVRRCHALRLATSTMLVL